MKTETTVRIKFWFKGALHTRKQKGFTVDLPIEAEKTDDKDFVSSKAYDSLSEAITHGLVDVYCDAGVQDFGVQRVSFTFKGEADVIY